MDLIEIRTAAGLYVGHRHRLSLDLPRLERAVCKIVRGLYYHEYREAAPPDRVTRTVMDPVDRQIAHPMVQHVLVNGRGRKVGEDVFDYRILRSADTPGIAFCAMLFLGRVLVLTWLMRSETAPPLGG